MAVQIYTLIRTANVVTLTTETAHGFTAAAPITVSGVLGGGTAPFNGNYTVSTIPSTTSITYAQTGANGTADSSISLTSIARYLTTANQIQVVTSSPHGILAAKPVAVRLNSVTQTGGDGSSLQTLIMDYYASTKVKVVNTTTLILTLPRNVTNWYPLSGGNLVSSSIEGVVALTSDSGGDASTDPITVPVTRNTSESVAVKQLLKLIDSSKASDPYVQRILSTSDVSKITTNAAVAPVTIQQPASTLRSALDTIIETFGSDFKKRRYYVNLSQQLVYEIVDDSIPTYATAPYVLTTAAIGNPNTSTGKASINPFALSVAWDHNTTKRAVFSVAGVSTTARVTTVTYDGKDALGTAYTRRGAPTLDATVDYPNSSSDQTVATATVAKSFFLERHAPVLSITAEIRGAGTASWNNLGFSAGYYQTGASTYALRSRWEPGQYVEIQAAELSLSGLFRVESVEWSLEASSYQQVIKITANRRPATSLTSLITKAGK